MLITQSVFLASYNLIFERCSNCAFVAPLKNILCASSRPIFTIGWPPAATTSRYTSKTSGFANSVEAFMSTVSPRFTLTE